MLLNHDDFLRKNDVHSDKVFEKEELEYIIRKKDIEIDKLNEYITLLKKQNSELNDKLLLIKKENKKLN